MLSPQTLIYVVLFFCASCLSLPFGRRDISNGPAIASNFPDPAFIQVKGTYYAYSTNSGGLNVPMAASTDFDNWVVANRDALPDLPAWTTGNIWAPDVLRLPNGQFVLYFAGSSSTRPFRHCVGAALSATVEGPYEAIDTPLVCSQNQGGAIDPAGFIDTDGRTYVVYKIDGNNLGGGGTCGNGDLSHPVPIMIQEVSSTDGVTLVGNPSVLLQLSPADGPVIEAPSLAKATDGTYFLFFSSNCYNGPYYDISYATASAVRGPYTKVQAPHAPLLVSGDENGKLNSPGGADVSPDGTKILFHSDLKPSDPSTRQMWSAKLSIDGGYVSIVSGSGPSDASSVS